MTNAKACKMFRRLSRSMETGLDAQHALYDRLKENYNAIRRKEPGAMARAKKVRGK